MGMALVHSYALEEEMNITTLENYLSLASQYLDDMIEEGSSTDEIQAWLAGYFPKFTNIIGEGVDDFYAVIDSTIVASNPWEGDATYQYEDTQWYQQAVQANGAIVHGNLYEDAVTGQQIFTISKALSRPAMCWPCMFTFKTPPCTTPFRPFLRTSPIFCVMKTARCSTR